MTTAHALDEPPLPRVSGRHRNKALASARKKRAIELRTQGLTYQAIADEMGYANAGSVYTIIKAAQRTELATAVREHRESELARLDALQVALWPKAMAGQVDAIKTCLQLITERCRLLGLHEDSPKRPATEEWDSCQGPPTVVLRAVDCRHDGCDRHGKF
jgi:transposase-like protein